MITIKVTGFDEVMRMVDALPKDINRAIGRSINDAAKHGTTEISRLIRDEYNIKKRDLDKAISVTQKGRANWPMAVITISGRSMPLVDFGAYQYQTIRGNRFKNYGKHWQEMKRLPKGKQGVYVSVLKGKPANIKPAFIANSKFGQPMVYLRDSKEKRIAPMFVKTIPSFMLGGGRVEKVTRSVSEYYENRLVHHIQRIGQ